MRPTLSCASAGAWMVWIVDDEQSVLSLCCDLGEDWGWNGETSFTTDEALQILGNIHIDCLITDICVPRGGIALIRKVRSMLPAMRIFALSQYGNIQTAIEAIRLGAMDFITKPFVIEDFQNILNLCSRSEKKVAGLEQSSRKPNRILDAAGLGVALYDSHHRCLAINATLADTGFPRQQNFVIPQNERNYSHHSDAEPNVQSENRDGVSLTRRETETLRNLAEGKCNKEIAEALALSPQTIDTDRKRIMSKPR